MVSKINQLIIYYVVCIGVLLFILYLPDLLGHPIITVVDKTNIILSTTIALFAIVQGMVMFNQYELQSREILVGNARNELEKAYGPLYTILNCPISETNTYIRMIRDTKIQLDTILSTYPFMFTEEIRKNWKEKIQRIEPEINTVDIQVGIEHPTYHIPIEFRNKVNEEYNRRLQKYNQLLEKEKAKLKNQ